MGGEGRGGEAGAFSELRLMRMAAAPTTGMRKAAAGAGGSWLMTWAPLSSRVRLFG